MPELPEVQTVVNTLRQPLVGRTIKRVLLSRRDIVHPDAIDLPGLLEGRTIAAIERRGKRIVFSLDNRTQFFIHLGMTGRLVIAQPTEEEPKHTHLKLNMGDGLELRFRDPRRFGGVWWLGAMDEEQPDLKMGPEPLGLPTARLAEALRRTTRAVKSALLDQRVVAGLGNIYVDEALYGAGIHPLTRACDLSPIQVKKLNQSIKTTLRRAIRHRGSTLRDYVDAQGNKGDFQKLHRVYARTGEPCARCPQRIRKIVVGGRSTHFCPDCQARPRSRKRPSSART